MGSPVQLALSTTEEKRKKKGKIKRERAESNIEGVEANELVIGKDLSRSEAEGGRRMGVGGIQGPRCCLGGSGSRLLLRHLYSTVYRNQQKRTYCRTVYIVSSG